MITPINAIVATIKKDSTVGNVGRFTTGNDTETITVWEVYNSRTRSQVQSASKVYNDETRIIVRTHDKLAGELQSDDAVVIDGYSYSVQTTLRIKTPISFYSYDWEITLK